MITTTMPEDVVMEDTYETKRSHEDDENQEANDSKRAKIQEQEQIARLRRMAPVLSEDESLSSEDDDDDDDDNFEDGKSAEESTFVPIELTKNQFLVHLLDDVIASKCSHRSLVKYVLYSLPGMHFETKKTIMSAGPSLGKYVHSREEYDLYAYSKLVRYVDSKAYEDMKRDVLFPNLQKKQPNMYDTYLSDIKTHHVTESVERHTVRISDDTDLT